ncbi:MAG: potassium-transporting ATPase subunit B [Bdellovibrionales bacterium]|nr:potassium-transporting ATPase subunit B [Bdellovibrionales bacterium]
MAKTTTNQWTNPEILIPALKDAFLKFAPPVQMRNPVMFVTEIGALITTLYAVFGIGGGSHRFEFHIALWLWFTVLFANFAEAIAEGRGKAQAAELRKTRTATQARLLKNGKEPEFKVNASELKKGDIVICEAGNLIPGDGEVVEGIASVDESAITGESAPVIRESGGDRSAVTGGTRVISDRILVKITAEQGHAFLDRMIALVEGAKRQKTPNEIALSIVLSGLTIVFLLAVMTLKPFADYSGAAAGQDLSPLVTVPVLIALLVCLIPTTIGGLLSAIGISGMDRLIRRNVIATSGRAVEAAGDIDVLLLDKTGTITLGNRMATAFIPMKGVGVERLAEAAQFALRAKALQPHEAKFIPFSAQTRMSGIALQESGKLRSIRKGAGDSIKALVRSNGGTLSRELDIVIEDIAKKGQTPIVVSEGREVLCVVQLKDIVKGGIKERFAELRKMGIRTVMITGDNAMTAAAIAAEAGVDDFMAQATPEAKLKRIREEQGKGHLVAMTGDGTNDAPALAQADVGVAMNTGTQAAREAGNMVDLDSNPTKLIEIVEIGKQLLMTRGSLTTFSIANDVAKYFAILPALFSSLYLMGGMKEGPLASLNVMGLNSPESAILSAVIFNALIIVVLIPLALKGVQYRAMGASLVLQRNLLIYGLGGLIAPFIGIKIIDVMINAIGLV